MHAQLKGGLIEENMIIFFLSSSYTTTRST